MENDFIISNGELYHHGIMGMKWGIRRYQNADGSYTAAGKARYNVGTGVTNLKRGTNGSGNTKGGSKGTTFKQRRARKTYERIHNIRKDEKRMDKMSANQLRSLSKAEKYWKQRSEGKTPTSKRGFIRRQADWYRSYNAAQRLGITAGANVLSSGISVALASRQASALGMGKELVIAKGKEAVTNTAWNMAFSELLYSKALGHF